MTARPAISAHKGGDETHAAATIEAYAAAVATGAEYVEFDVRRLADGSLVCYHDALTGPGGRPLATIGYRDLCATTGYEVPLVAQVLAVLSGRATGHVDLKETGYETDVVRLAAEHLGEDGMVVTSLEDRSVAEIRRVFPRVPAALSLGRSARGVAPYRLPRMVVRETLPMRRIRACGATWVALHKTLARYGLLDLCHRHGLGTMVWTVDEDPLIDRFVADPRVDVLVTNRPSAALSRRAALRSA